MSNKDSFNFQFDVGFENKTPAQNTNFVIHVKLYSHRQYAIILFSHYQHIPRQYSH